MKSNIRTIEQSNKSPLNNSPTRRGFTIVELLVVVAIIGVLLGIVSVAARGAIKNGRAKRADAMCRVLQQAIGAYNAKMGRWPATIENKIKSLGNTDDETYTFTGAEADEIFYEIVHASVGSSATMPLVDAQALFVADSSKLRKNGEGCYDNHAESSLKTYCGNQRCVNGVDFAVASKKGKGHIQLKKMAYGFQGSQSGKFCRFWVSYNLRTDSVSVSRKRPDWSRSDSYQYPKGWE